MQSPKSLAPNLVDTLADKYPADNVKMSNDVLQAPAHLSNVSMKLLIALIHSMQKHTANIDPLTKLTFTFKLKEIYEDFNKGETEIEALFRDPNDKHFTNQAYLKDFLTTHKSDNFLKECIGIRNTSTGIEYFPLFTMLKVDFYDKSKKPISPLITIEINDHWKDDLLDAIQNYSLVKLKNIMSLNDKYSIKLYNLILSNLDHRHKEELQYFYIDLTKLKEFLGVPDNMYYCYRDKEAKAKGLKKFNRAAFQKRALEPALKEIIIKTNVKAHIYYTYKPGKKREKAYLFIAYEKYTPGDLYYGSPSNTVGKVGLYNIPYTIGDRDYDRITLKDFTTPSEQELEDLILEMQRQEPSKNLVDILSKRWVPKD